jgi:hypothetical protein
MAIGTALVDKGRIHRRSKTSDKVDGERQMTESVEVGGFFKCRLFPSQTSEVQRDGRREATTRHEFIVGRKTLIDASDLIEVESKNVTGGMFRVAGPPEELRKKRTVIGYKLTLVRAE